MQTQEINLTKPTEMLPLVMWVFEGTKGAIICDEQGPCKRPETDPTTCFGCPVAWRERNGKTEYRYQPVHGS